MTEREIFTAAMNQTDPVERAAWLSEQCAGNTPLRQRIESLLAEHQQLGSFMDLPTATLSHSAEHLGTQIGPYKLLQQIGEGGMGVVYMAEQTEPVQRKVALKVIKPGMDSRQVIARFEAERQALAMMDHVNIARVLDAGLQQGRPYFVMELVHGVPITKYCDDNRLTPRQRLELFVPVCEAIQHAHQKGIIHRDIKPSNVMVTLYDGKPVPKVIDFGVAKATDQKLTERTLFTQYGTMVGTLEYMSPEQAEMSALGVDTRSDIYSLGVLLYELLTGSTPLSSKRVKEAAYAEILRLIKEEEPPKPSTRLSDTGEALASISAQRHMEPAKLSKLMRGELDWIVMKTLEKDRNRRYESASGLAADVLRHLNHEAVQAYPPSAWYRFRKFAGRNKRVLATASLIATVLVAGMVVSTWQAIRAKEAEGRASANYETAEDQRQKVEKQLVLTEQAQNQGLRRLYESRLAEAKAGSLSRREGQRLNSLSALGKAAALARELKLPVEHDLQLRNAAIACLALPDLRIANEWTGWFPGSVYIDFDGDLKTYACSNAQGEIRIHRVSDDVPIASIPAMGVMCWPILTRDGKYLSMHSSKKTQLWSIAGSKPALVLSLDSAGVAGMAFSQDSRQFVVSDTEGVVTLHDLVADQPARTLPRGVVGAQLVISPTNRQFAISCNSVVEIRNLESGQVDAKLEHTGPVSNLAWHPNGQMVAVACNQPQVVVWNTLTGKKVFVLEGFNNGGIQMAFSHSGRLLATTGWEEKMRLWDARTGRLLFSTTGAGGMVPRFSSDDRFLGVAIRGDKLGVWEVAECAEYRTLVHTPPAVSETYYNPSVCADGRLLAVGLYGGMGLWELSSGRELHFLESPGINFVASERSGALLSNSPAGMLRWAFIAETSDANKMQAGPPVRLSIPGSSGDIACSLDGRVMASAQSAGGVSLHADQPDQPVSLGPHGDVRYIAVSPDGKLVVTGSHSDTAVKIWDSKKGTLITELPGASWRPFFSPDGKWLGTVAGGIRLWKVGSWKEGPKVGGGEGAAFSPDSKLLAVESGVGSIRLLNPDTGAEYARLEDPYQDRARHITFSPDGTQLIATNDDSRSIHVWDLRAIRSQLAALHLDWDLPSYAPSDAGKNARPLQLTLDLGELGKATKP